MSKQLFCAFMKQACSQKSKPKIPRCGKKIHKKKFLQLLEARPETT